METQEIIVVIAKGLSVLFVLTLFLMLIMSMRKDGKFTADEASKVVIMLILIYMTVVNGQRTTEYPTFGDGTYLILVGAVLLLAGIDMARTKDLLNNGNRDNDSKNSK